MFYFFLSNVFFIFFKKCFISLFSEFDSFWQKFVPFKDFVKYILGELSLSWFQMFRPALSKIFIQLRIRVGIKRAVHVLFLSFISSFVKILGFQVFNCCVEFIQNLHLQDHRICFWRNNDSSQPWKSGQFLARNSRKDSGNSSSSPGKRSFRSL